MEHHNDLIAQARALEQQSKWEEAAPLYAQVAKEDPLNETVIQRLLVVYRKLKEYKKEMQLLNASLKANAAKMQQQQTTWSKKHAKAAKASRALHSLGGAKANNVPVYEEAIVKTWQKRKENLARRLKKA